MAPVEERVWQILDEMRDRLARIDEQLKQRPCEDHEKRMRELEDSASRTVKLVALFGLIATAVGTGIGSFIGWIRH